MAQTQDVVASFADRLQHVQRFVGACPPLMLSHMTENRTVEARKSLIFQHPIVVFCL